MDAPALEREGDRLQSTLLFDEVYIGVSQRNVAISGGESDDGKATKQEQIALTTVRDRVL